MYADDQHVETPSTAEWSDFRDRVVQHRQTVERTLRRELVHDPRAGSVRLQNVAVRDLADEALCQVLDDWRSKPGGTPPFQWMLKRGLHLLDETLDREALAAESRAEEREEQRRLFAHEILHDDEERARWREIAGFATRAAADAGTVETGDDRLHFDGIASSRNATPERQVEALETLRMLADALLTLSEPQRRAVSHRYLDGLDVDDVAFLLDVSATDVAMHLEAGLAALRVALAAQA